jgi:hypothetical protein
MNKKPINVYYTTGPKPSFNDDGDWSFLYPKPKTLFSDLIDKRKNVKDSASYFLCPAVSSKFKKILVFKNPINCSYSYEGKNIKETSDQYISAQIIREPTLDIGPTVEFALNYHFFADEPLLAYFTPPFFHKANYTKYGTVMPGEFDIGKWYRPYNVEFQMWENKGDLILKEDEPLFYLEFKTDRPIVLHRHVQTYKTGEYLSSMTKSPNLFGRFQSLNDKYEKFKNVGYREKILTEINKNLIDEEPYRF